MQQAIDLDAAVTARMRAAGDGTILLADEPVSESGGWMHIAVRLAMNPVHHVLECSVRVRISVDRDANRRLYLDQIEVSGRRFAGLGSVGATFGKSLADAVPAAIAAHFTLCLNGRLSTQPELAAPERTTGPVARPGIPRSRVTRTWGV